MTIPTMTTERLILRAFTEADTDDYYEVLNGDNVLLYFPPIPLPTKERTQQMMARLLSHWEQHNYGLWAVTLAETGQFLGRCGIQHISETDEVEVDFMLHPQFWGKGFAAEAGKASLKYGFDNLDVNEIVGIVHPENIASQRALQKIGMQYIETKEYFGMTCQRYVKKRS